MRLKLLLHSARAQSIPINYQYPLMIAIMKMLETASKDYASFIHNSGYKGLDGKNRKLFTFSKIFFSPRPDLLSRRLFLKPKTTGALILSSPMIDDFLKNFILGASQNRGIQIEKANFEIASIEQVQQPNFSNKMRFRTLSPIAITTVRLHNGKESTYYYRPLDNDLSHAVKKSLIGKYQSVFQKNPDDTNLDFKIDREYIAARGGEANISKLVHIKENLKSQTTKIKAFESPFYLEGSQELMQVAWDCGIGDKTNMGFGCIGL